LHLPLRIDLPVRDVTMHTFKRLTTLPFQSCREMLMFWRKDKFINEYTKLRKANVSMYAIVRNDSTPNYLFLTLFLTVVCALV